MTNDQFKQLSDSIIIGGDTQRKTLYEIYQILDKLKTSKEIVDRMKYIMELEFAINKLREGQEQLDNAYLLLNNSNMPFNYTELGIITKQVSGTITDSFTEFIKSCETLINEYKSNWAK